MVAPRKTTQKSGPTIGQAGKLASVARPAEIAPRLLPWYQQHRRSLPWRESPDPYRVWVSEIMLQQTRVETVIPYYHRFLERFPRLEDLAQSEEEEVLTLWSGLGYYRRARSLRAGAIEIESKHDGKFPDDVTTALTLPGVGRYTAGAVLSIAYGLPVPIVDGNVERVMSRLFCIEGDPRRGAAKQSIWKLAEESLADESPGDFNQSLMELGATVCTPQNPGCERCPLQTLCTAFQNGNVAHYPQLAGTRQPVAITLQVAIVRQRGRFLLQRITNQSFLRGMWMFPFVETASPDALLSVLTNEFGLSFRQETQLPVVRHSITFRRLRVESTVLSPSATISIRGKPSFRWASAAELGASVPVSSLALKIRRALETTDI